MHELIYAVNEDSNKNVEQALTEGSKLHQLYTLIENNEHLTDELAFKSIYPDSQSTNETTDKKYLMLKRNLVNKLFEIIYSGEFKNGSRGSVLFEHEKRIAVAHRLIHLNVYHNAEKIGKKVFKEAHSQRLTQIELMALRLLRKIYALKGEYKEFEKIIRLFDRTREVAELEDEYLSRLQAMESAVKFSGSCHPRLVIPFEKFLESNLSIHGRKTYQPQVRYLALKMEIIINNEQNDIKQVYSYSKELEKLIKKGRVLNLSTDSMLIELNKARYHCALQNSIVAEAHYMKAQQISNFKAFDRFEVEAVGFRVYLQQGEYDRALEVVRLIEKCPQYDRLVDVDKELWLLRGLICYIFAYFRDNETIDPQKWTPYSEYNLNTLLIETSTIQRDKEGFNIQVIIARTLLLILKGEYERLLDESNNVKIYFQRYLKNMIEGRTKVFMKNLSKLLKNYNEVKKLERIDKKFQEDMNLQREALDRNEWIPYQTLWNIILDGLKQGL